MYRRLILILCCLILFSYQQKDGTFLYPARSCRDILNYYSFLQRFSAYQNVSLPNGNYFLRNNGAPYQAFCDMANGGFTLVMRIEGSQNTFRYSSTLWTTSNLLNPNNFTIGVESKYEAYNHVLFNRLRLQFAMSYNNIATDRTLTIQASGTALLSKINTGGAFDVSPAVSEWLALGGPYVGLQTNCNNQGFNANGNMRIGIVANQENDCLTPDSFFGVGHSGYSACSEPSPHLGAGNMHSCNAGPYTPGNFVHVPGGFPARAWISVGDTHNCASLNFCNGRGVCSGGNTCTCDANSGYGGAACNVPICFTRLATDTANVCSGKGSCIAPDVCICTPGISGVQCEEPFEAETGFGTFANPATSCYEIQQKFLLNRQVALSGLYWLYYGSLNNRYQVFCDMITSGGGWTMVMKTTANNPVFAYESGYWTNTSLFNSGSVNLTVGDAKFASFNSVPFQEIMITMTTDSSAYGGGFSTNSLIRRVNASSMLELFLRLRESTMNTNLTANNVANDWRGLAGPYASIHPSCTREAVNFNQLQNFGYGMQKVRLGLISGDTNCNHIKSVIGIGISSIWGNTYHGNAMACDCGSDNGFKTVPASTFIYVRESYSCRGVNFCSSNGKCVGENQCICNVNFYGSNCSIAKDWGSITFPASSCAHVYATNSSRVSGTYYVNYPTIGVLLVYCGLPQGWTLVESFQRDNGAYHTAGFVTSLPRNVATPNLNDYRLSYAQMSAVVSTVNLWAITCNADLSFTNDFMIMDNGVFNIFFSGAGSCQFVRSVAIRNNRCTNCHVKIWNDPSYHMHVDSSLQTGCPAPALSVSSAYPSENNFGYYQEGSQTVNPNFACTATSTSTTNYWMRLSCSKDICNGRGTCVNDQCNCNPGYTGLNCNTYTCFGKTVNDPSVCNSNGKCVAPDTCLCNPGTTGSTCTVAVLCFGLDAADPQVCSGHGVCNGPNSCVCSAGYGGPRCNVSMCNNILATSADVCSGKGTCTSPNVCACQAGYTGGVCQNAICYGLMSTATAVCNFRNGTCASPNNCSCNSGYVGTQCEQSICHGVLDSDPTVCSFRNGTCVAANTCFCNVGYFGNNCQNFTCTGVSSFNPSTCSGHGTCIRYNTCVCSAGYQGTNCEQPICYGRPSADLSVCSRNGSCIAPNMCNCTSGYTGLECQIPICYGIAGNVSAVCSRNGTCINRNNCLCDIGYTGNSCNIPICFGLPSNSSSVCNSRNGTCVSRDNCHCSSNYTGSSCQFPICYGIASNLAQVCSGHGACSAPQRCTCQPLFSGPECATPICYGISAANASVCAGHGACIDGNTCICSPGYVGNQCEQFGCYGFAPSNPSVCSGHGTCLGPNSCTCSSGWVLSNCSVPTCYGVTGLSIDVCSGHGSCSNINTCTCSNAYVGAQCEVAPCFGIAATSPLVCNMRNGTCTNLNTCACSGYTGNECQIPICYNRTGMNACSGNGVCVRNNSCVCFNNYIGLDCAIPLCNGIPAGNTSVCNGRGTCVSPNSCSCSSEYAGSNCQLPACNGISSQDAQVCSSRGTCVSPNQCNCSSLFTGANCETPVITCFGRIFNDPLVCSGHGTCSTNGCSCTQGYTGTQCENPVCFGIHGRSSAVCSGKGVCVANDTCSCFAGFGSSNCSQFQCFANSTSPNNCAHGTCVGPNRCLCSLGYVGARCNVSVCFGKRSDDPAVCSSSGVCYSPNRCTCSPGKTGIECQSVSCYGVQSSSATVCNGHGTCSSPDVCSCNTGYTGTQCQNTICYGIESSNPSVCSSSGNCTSPNTCKCRHKNQVGDCGSCSQNYIGSDCSTFVCSSSTCNGAGTCNSTSESCNCHASTATGFFAGRYCTECANGYVGITCNTVCSTNLNCSGHGVCSRFGGCTCFNNSLHGYWSGSSCSQCATGYFGTNCLAGIIGVSFANSGDRIRFQYVYPERNGRQQVPASEIFDSETVALLGSSVNNIRCWWPDPQSDVMEIILGDNSRLLPNARISILVDGRANPKLYAQVTVGSPIATAKPIIEAKAPSIVGASDPVRIDATSSTSSDRRELSFSWIATSGYRLNELNAFLSSQNGPIVNIPSHLIEPGYSYSFQGVSRSSLNVTSDPITISVSKVASTVPIASVVGPSKVQITQQARPYTVYSKLIQNVGLSGDVTVVWSQISGPVVGFTQKMHDLIIHTLPYSAEPYDIVFSIRAFRTSLPSLVTEDTVSVTILPSAPIATILGGSSRSIRTSSLLVLDAESMSIDPSNSTSIAQYYWSCKSTSRSCNMQNESTPILAIPANSLLPGVYEYTLIYVKDSRVSTSTVSIDVLEAEPGKDYPVPSLKLPINEITTSSGKVSIQGSTLINGMTQPSVGQVNYEWVLTEVSNPTVNVLSSVASGSSSEQTLVIDTSKLVDGISYSLSLNVTYTNNSAQTTGYAKIIFPVLSKPLVGVFTCAPSSGFAGQTEFSLTASQFVSANPPLQYTFVFVDRFGKDVPLVFYSTSNNLQTTLPQGFSGSNLTIAVIAKDSKGSSVRVETIVTVHPVRAQNSNQTVVSLARQMQQVLNATTINSELENSLLVSRVQVILDMLNEDIPNRTSTTPKVFVATENTCISAEEQNCPNSCSGEGTCVTGKCVCNTGRKGIDCRYTMQELAERETLRYNLLQGVFTAIQYQLQSRPNDEVAIQQLALLCSKLTTLSEEVTYSTQQVVVQYLENIMATVEINEKIGEILLQTLSNILQSVGTRDSDLYQNANTTRTLETADALMRKLALVKLAGDRPTTFITPAFSTVIVKQFRANLAGKSLSVCSSSSSSMPTITLPSLLAKVDYNNSVNVFGDFVPNEINFKASLLTRNPYARSQNISSNIVRINLLRPDGKPIRLRRMMEPLEIKVPLKDLTNLNSTRHRVICKYWDTVNATWSSEGCILKGISYVDNVVNCNCNHTTDFAVFIEEQPIKNTTTEILPQQIPILSILTDSRYATIIFSAVFIFTVISNTLILGICTKLLACIIKTKEPEKESFSAVKYFCHAFFEAFIPISMIVPNEWRFAWLKYRPTMTLIEKSFMIGSEIFIVVLLHALTVQNYSNAPYDIQFLFRCISVSAISFLAYRVLCSILANAHTRDVIKIYTEKSKVKYEDKDDTDSQTSSPQRSSNMYRSLIPTPQRAVKEEVRVKKVHDPDTSPIMNNFAFKIVGFLACIAGSFVVIAGVTYCMQYFVPLPTYWTFAASGAIGVLTVSFYMQVSYFRNLKTKSAALLVLLSLLGAALLILSSIFGAVLAIFAGLVNEIAGYAAIGCAVVCASSIVWLAGHIIHYIRVINYGLTESFMLPSWITLIVCFASIVISGGCIAGSVYKGLTFDQNAATLWTYSVLLSAGLNHIIGDTMYFIFLCSVHFCLKRH